MKRNRIKLTENSLRAIIKETVKNILKEGQHTNHNNTPQQERRAWADYKIKNGIQDADRSGLSYHDDWGEDKFDFDDNDITYPNMSDDEFDIEKDWYDEANDEMNHDYSEDDRERLTTPEFDTRYEIDGRPRHRIDTHHLEKYANKMGDNIKNRQMDKMYDEYGNPSQYKQDEWIEGEPSSTWSHSTPKQQEIDQAWNEHNSLNESKLNQIIRKNIRKVLY